MLPPGVNKCEAQKVCLLHNTSWTEVACADPFSRVTLKGKDLFLRCERNCETVICFITKEVDTAGSPHLFASV